MHSPSSHPANALPNYPQGRQPGHPGQPTSTPQLAAVHTYPSPTPDSSGPPVHIKVRWIRVLAALALVGVGAYFLTTYLTADSSPPQETSKQVSADRAVAPVKTVKPTTSKPAVKPGKNATPKAGKTTTPNSRPSTPSAAPATPPATAAGGGTAPSRGSTVANQRGASGEELPFTGLPVWVAVLMGCMLIGGGVWVQLNALQIGTTASGYRRGPALRPFETYRHLFGK